MCSFDASVIQSTYAILWRKKASVLCGDQNSVLPMSISDWKHQNQKMFTSSQRPSMRIRKGRSASTGYNLLVVKSDELVRGKERVDRDLPVIERVVKENVASLNSKLERAGSSTDIYMSKAVL